MSDKSKFLFMVIADGHTYTVYPDGSVEGWEQAESVIIFNQFPSLAAQAIMEQLAERKKLGIVDRDSPGECAEPGCKCHTRKMEAQVAGVEANGDPVSRAQVRKES